MYVESDGNTHASLNVGKKSSTTQVRMRMHARTHTHSYAKVQSKFTLCQQIYFVSAI